MTDRPGFDGMSASGPLSDPNEHSPTSICQLTCSHTTPEDRARFNDPYNIIIIEVHHQMPIVQAGAVNNTALIVPDLYVEIVPPQNLILNGVPTNILGVVGTSTWGPLSTPVIMGSMSDYYANFGPVMARKYDM